MTRSLRAGLLALGALLLVAPSAAAQTFGTINLATGFLPDPQRFPGASGGPVAAQGVQSNCRGWIPSQPSHVLITSTGFNFLRIFSESQGDTTLMVRSTQMTWCADDTYGFNPGLDLQSLPPGRYDIYVGSYAQNARYPYQLAVSELSSTTPGASNPTYNPVRNTPAANNIIQPNLPPNFGRIALANGFRGNRQARGRTGGALNAAGLSGEGVCRGFITGPPDHLLTITSPMPYLHIFVLSAADSTLIIRRPNGSLVCNDDTYGLNPSVEGQFSPGTYQIWVGGYVSGESRPYRMTLTQNPTIHP